ncbi:hypothetical protein [Nesterenkonia sp.]|uniref:VG15 protein n=1 Tax=Nesterenkonia sp. TaxID=704201 RepID=UPI00261D50FE|nr:hypothetical protein [Nesterenkonia sp.]
MTTRDQVDRLATAQAKVYRMVKRRLDSLLPRLQSLPPDQARDLLLAVIPVLVEEHGNLAATAAAEWYEETRAQQVTGTFRSRLGANPPTNDIQRTVRRTAGHLFTGDPAATIGALAGAVQRYVAGTARDTIRRNMLNDPTKPRWAVIPSGAKTCAFCEMLASRGWQKGAAEAGAAGFHDHCDCQIVPEWDKSGRNHVEGYDPDQMYERYSAARAELEADGLDSGDTRLILARMRDMYPDRYTDGHAVPLILRDPVHGWPDDRVLPVTPRTWEHILEHGPGGSKEDQFNGTRYEIAKDIRRGITEPQWQGTPEWRDDVYNYHWRLPDGREALAGGIAVKEGDPPVIRLLTAYPVSDRSRRMLP